MEGHDEEALALFRRAHSLAPSARARAQIGLAEQALGRWVLAERDVAGALEVTGDSWVRKNRTDLVAALEAVRDHLGRVAVLGSPIGAIILINGERIGKLPQAEPLSVPAGEAVVGLMAPGHVSLMRKINVFARALVSETIDLPVDTVSIPEGVVPSASPVSTPTARPLAAANSRKAGYTIIGGTVFDTKTNLTWQQILLRNDDGVATYTHPDAATYCSRLTLNGGRWRLPEAHELETIVDNSMKRGTLIDQDVFPGTPPTLFWSSTALVGSRFGAWFVNFRTGEANAFGISSTLAVRCVR
jgi:hypothetical protein